jgi:hypothetical protein
VVALTEAAVVAELDIQLLVQAAMALVTMDSLEKISLVA